MTEEINMIRLVIFSLFFVLNVTVLFAEQTVQGPHVLVVMAHPDDESTFSVTLYKIVKEQHEEMLVKTKL